ncbi:MAG: MBL fold metallo-hydrolase [Fluviicola sp.]
MEVKINMLNVKDGDAIIVELIKPDKELVMVIDCGHTTSFASKVKPKLESILSKYNKQAPDIVVCTHYDNDHICGLVPLVEKYITDIKEVWIHETPESMKGFMEQALKIQSNGGMKKIASKEKIAFLKLFEGYHSEQQEILNEKSKAVLYSVGELQKLIRLIPKEKIKHVFHKDKPLADWPEITVLGPTKSYFDSLFPETKSFEDFVKDEAFTTLSMIRESLILEVLSESSCNSLKSETTTSITETNKASIIIAIDTDAKRYLFTGDAGIESFKKIPDWQNELKNLYFLKIPHHGSINNISKELTELMNPVYAYNSGSRHQDDVVLNCLKEKSRNKEVKSTKTDGDLYFDK